MYVPVLKFLFEKFSHSADRVLHKLANGVFREKHTQALWSLPCDFKRREGIKPLECEPLPLQIFPICPAFLLPMTRCLSVFSVTWISRAVFWRCICPPISNPSVISRRFRSNRGHLLKRTCASITPTLFILKNRGANRLCLCFGGALKRCPTADGFSDAALCHQHYETASRPGT